MLTQVKLMCAAVLACVAVAACSRPGMGQDEMAWARAALERNEGLQVVASDPQARTFTVKLKGSGQLIVVPVERIVGAPAAQIQVAADAGTPVPPPVPEPASVAQAPAQIADQGTPPAPGATAAPSAPQMAGSVTPSDAGDASASAGDKASADREGVHAESAAQAREGSVLASGPGYSIKASGPRNSPARVASGTSAVRGTPVERLHDPIICQGSRMLHIDNRNLEFDGDAVSAEDGCEIHITNTRISAKGIGVLARAANVHIDNSDIEGDSGAIDASDGAQVYASFSRFKGVNRRMESSAFHDLGGNVWN